VRYVSNPGGSRPTIATALPPGIGGEGDAVNNADSITVAVSPA